MKTMLEVCAVVGGLIAVWYESTVKATTPEAQLLRALFVLLIAGWCAHLARRS